MTVLPREAGVSWESHLGGALAGVLAAFLFRRGDPVPPRAKYSWETRKNWRANRRRGSATCTNAAAPHDVPVLWQRDAETSGERGRVLPFRRPGE